MRGKDKIKQDSCMCKKVCDMLERLEWRTNHPSQRLYGAWRLDYRDNFIVTVLRNEDFDSIKICEQTINGVTVDWVIDGKQRCTTLLEFRAGKFSLGKNLNPATIIYEEVKKDENGMILKDENDNPVYEEIEYDLRGKSYKDLPDALKEEFNNCTVQYVKHLDCTDEELMRHMIRYNNCSEMRPNQKMMVGMANIAKDIRKLSGHPFWLDCATLTDKTFINGTLERNVSEILMSINFWENWTKDSTRMSKYLNENATKEMFNNLESEMDELMDIVGGRHKEKFTSKSAIIWVKFFDECKQKSISSDVYSKFLDSFEQYEKIPVQVTGEYNNPDHTRDEKVSVINYHDLAKDRSTKDRGIIEDKLHILHTLINKFMEDNGIEITSQDEENIDNVEVTDDVNEISDDVAETSESQNTNETVDVVEPEENTVVEDESIIDDLQESIPEDELVEFVKQNTELNVDVEDIALYKDMVEDSIHITSPLYQKCYKAVIALMAEACENEMDEEFGEWIHKHENEDNNYSNNQRVNYLYFKRDFDRAVSAIG